MGDPKGLGSLKADNCLLNPSGLVVYEVIASTSLVRILVSLVNVRWTGQRSAISGQTRFLLIVEIALEAYFAFNDVHFGIGGTFAIFAVTGIDFVVGEAHGDGFYGPLFATSVEMRGDDFTGGERAEE